MKPNHLLLLAALLLPTATFAEDFPLPASLRPAVDFWTRVYTEIDTRQGYIHDDRNFRTYATITLQGKQSYRQQRRQIRRTVAQYRRAAEALAHGKRSGLGALEEQVLAAWPQGTGNAEFAAAAKRMRFQRGQANKFRAGLERSGRWQRYIADTFADMGLPAELTILPHVESSFHPGAKSHVGATGMWQFTRGTARRFMRADHVVDERLDPYASTVAAAQLLKYNYSVLQSWPLALTAYNHGVAGMRRAVAKLGSKDIGAIVAKYQGRTFGFASRNFYASFLAALHIDRNAERYFPGLNKQAPPLLATPTVPAYMAAEAVADALGVGVADLRSRHPSLQPSVWQGNKFVPRGFVLRMPGDTAALQAALDQVATTEGHAKQKPDRYYTVQRGDTLSLIAARFKASIGELAALNTLRSAHRIRAGQTLRLPIRGETPAAVISKPASRPAIVASSDADGRFYRVRQGDTLSEIARHLNTETRLLAALNNINDAGRLGIGQRLKVPLPTTTVALAESAPEPASEVAAEPVDAATATPLESLQDETAETPTTEQIDSVALSASLVADPSDYSVAENDTIKVQPEETLGHYAEWLGLRASDIRRLNKLRYRQPVIVGRRIKLPFTATDKQTFERQRMQFHQTLQAAYFGKHRLVGTCAHTLKRGDSLWLLSQNRYHVPIWLLRQHNPDVNFDTTLPPGTTLTIPVTDSNAAAAGAETVATAGTCMTT